jgi:3-methyladenine DNA glycosylase AlkD
MPVAARAAHGLHLATSAIAKKIKTDHELALKLWDTGNVEAQLLATLIIKPT